MTDFLDFGSSPEIVQSLASTKVWYRGFGATMFALNILIADCLFVSLRNILGLSGCLTTTKDLEMLGCLGEKLDGDSYSILGDYCRIK